MTEILQIIRDANENAKELFKDGNAQKLELKVFVPQIVEMVFESALNFVMTEIILTLTAVLAIALLKMGIIVKLVPLIFAH